MTMTDLVLQDLLQESRHYAGEKPTDTLLQVSRAFLERANSDPEILRLASEALSTLPPAGAGWLALVLGTMVERGADAKLTAPGMLQFLRLCLSQLPVPEVRQDDEGEEDEFFPDPTPEQEELIEALQPICQGVVAHLARMPAERLSLAEDSAFMERLEKLEGYSHGLGWVRSALLRSSGTLIVLHPPSGTGLKLRYENVAYNFHLFSLLQAAVGTRIPDGRQPDPHVAAAARGETSDDVHDGAWWHYGDPRSKTPDLSASIWGEGVVTDIPVINGSRVMLLWPPLLRSRTWGAGFFSPYLQALPPNVVVEGELPGESARQWFAELGIE
jgi:hypothetical protein